MTFLLAILVASPASAGQLEKAIADLQTQANATDAQLSATNAALIAAEARIAVLEAQNAQQAIAITAIWSYTANELESAIHDLQNEVHTLTQGLANTALASVVDAQQLALESVQQDVTDLLDVTAFFSVATGVLDGLNGPHLMIEGANVHIRSGGGQTAGLGGGRGNLIVGYNESSILYPATDRGGAHNIVVGTGHQYPSYGGFVSGAANTISAPYASVSGGSVNVASGLHASVSGGVSNTASGSNSSILGGRFNQALNGKTSVCGGHSNVASGAFATVSGGHQRVANTMYSWAAGTLNESY